jgi:hypothetical protein
VKKAKAQKSTLPMILCIWNSRKGAMIVSGNTLVVPKWVAVIAFQEYQGTFQGDGNDVKLDNSDSCMTICFYIQSRLKMGEFCCMKIMPL